MNDFGNAGSVEPKPSVYSAARLGPVIAGLTAIALTFIIATAGIAGWRVLPVSAVGLLFVIACILTDSFRRTLSASPTIHTPPDGRRSDFEDIEDRLIALDEANEVFGSSLNAGDMFRLVSSRVGEIFPIAASALVVPGDAGETLKFVHFDGPNADVIRDAEIFVTDGLAGRAFANAKIEIDNLLAADAACLGRERLKGFSSAVAIPLIQGDEPFGVFELFTSEPTSMDGDTAKLLEAIGEHVTPIFRSSLAFERSLSSALTDSLTGLPNERAFYMVLENQLAESLRHRNDRPLTILSIDIRDFGAVNSMLGHSTGDRMLEFAGSRIGEHLRKMDFLARTVNDEFSVVLPTATEKVAFEIVERIKAGFAENEFEIADGEGVVVALNIGWATFWKDGETAEQLIRAAHQRKRETKSESPSGVLWFPKEYVN